MAPRRPTSRARKPRNSVAVCARVPPSSACFTLAGSPRPRCASALAAGGRRRGLALADGCAAQPDDRTAALATRIGELEAQVRELTARPAPIPESRVAELAARTASADLALRQVRELETRVAKAEAALAAPRATGSSEAASPEQLTAVDTTLKSLSEALTDLRKRVEDNATATQVARDTAMQSSGATSAVAADVGGEIAALSKRIDALDATLRSVQAAEAAKPDEIGPRALPRRRWRCAQRWSVASPTRPNWRR